MSWGGSNEKKKVQRADDLTAGRDVWLATFDPALQACIGRWLDADLPDADTCNLTDGAILRERQPDKESHRTRRDAA